MTGGALPLITGTVTSADVSITDTQDDGDTSVYVMPLLCIDGTPHISADFKLAIHTT